MPFLKPIQIMMFFAPFLIATQALSVQLNYSSNRVELVMLDPDNATFECAYNDLPAQIEINENTPANVLLGFRDSVFVPEKPTHIVVTRGGTKSTRSALDDKAISGFDSAPILDSEGFEISPDDWKLTVSGELDICVGLATLKVMHGSLDIFLQIRQYEAHLVNTDDVLKDLHDIRYAVNPSGFLPLQFLFSSNNSALKRLGMTLGNKKIGVDAPYDRQILGALSVHKHRTAVRFTSPNDLEGVVDNLSLNFKFLLVDPRFVSE
ncbi:MAG: hypothetical protein ABJM43_19515 [Paracoccaceae bacterium]